MAIDVDFSSGENRFNVRVAAYITYKDKLLLEKNDSLDFYTFSGGRVKIDENTNTAIRREMQEELGLKNISPKLIRIEENIFPWLGKKVFQLLFVYHIELNEKDFESLPEGTRIKDSESEKIYWINKKDLKKYKCLPALIYDLPKIDVGVISHNINIQ